MSGHKTAYWWDENGSPRVGSTGLGAEWEDPTFDAVVEEEHEDIEIDLSVLTPKQRFVIECSFGIGRTEISEREIARLMGISGPAVHKLKTKALTKLRGLAK